MKLVGIVLFILIATLFGSRQVQAQINLLNAKDLRNINIDDYTDDDLTSMYNRAIDNGISESQIYRVVAERGLSVIEISKLRKRLQGWIILKILERLFQIC